MNEVDKKVGAVMQSLYTTRGALRRAERSAVDACEDAPAVWASATSDAHKLIVAALRSVESIIASRVSP
jgi:hypothetical protein